MATYIDPWYRWTNTTSSSSTTSNLAIWNQWVYSGNVTTTTTTYDSLTTWGQWIRSGAQPRHDATWERWASMPVITSPSSTIVYAPPTPRTPEEEAAYQADRAAARRRQHRAHGIRGAKRLRASQRARELLLGVLTEEQRVELLEHQRITVRSHGRRYEVHAGKRQHNVFEVDDDGRRVLEFCGHAPEHVPQDDNLAAQVLMLQAEPDEFARVSNVWDLTAPAHARPCISQSGQPLQRVLMLRVPPVDDLALSA